MNTYNGCMLKHFIFLAQVFIKFKDGGHITTPVNCEQSTVEPNRKKKLTGSNNWEHSKL